MIDNYIKKHKKANNCGKHNNTYKRQTRSMTSKKGGNTIKNIDIKKNSIPKKLREEVWKHYNGETFKSACNVSWCTNIIDVFNYHVGHDIPESKGGSLDIINLKPICSSCNLSMGNRFSITDWNQIGINERTTVKRLKFYLKSSLVLLIIVSIALFGLYHEPRLKNHIVELLNY